MANFPSHAGRNGAQGWRADPTPSPGHDSTWQALPRRPWRRRARVCVCVHTPVFPRLQPAAPLIPPGPTQSTHTEAHRWLATPQQHWAQPRDQADGAVGGPFAKPSRQVPSEPSPRRPRKCPSTPEAPRRDERNAGANPRPRPRLAPLCSSSAGPSSSNKLLFPGFQPFNRLLRWKIPSLCTGQTVGSAASSTVSWYLLPRGPPADLFACSWHAHPTGKPLPTKSCQRRQRERSIQAAGGCVAGRPPKAVTLCGV